MIRPQAILSIRILALLLIVVGAGQLLANVIESIREFDPTYWWYYVQSEMLRPLLAIIFGKLLYLFSKPLGKLLASGIDPSIEK